MMQEKKPIKVVEIAYVGYPVADIERARSFYEGTLGLKESRRFGDDQSAWIEYDIGPNTLAIANMMPEWEPSTQGGAVALEVEDFDAAVERLKQDSTMFLSEPMESPVCWMTVIADPDGNALIIHKRKPGVSD